MQKFKNSGKKTHIPNRGPQITSPPTCTMKPFSLANAQGSPFRAECNPTPEHLHAAAPHHAKCDRIVEPLPAEGRTKPFHACWDDAPTCGASSMVESRTWCTHSTRHGGRASQ